MPTTTRTKTPATAEVTDLWPLLFVHDMKRSLAFYEEQLGFTRVGAAKGDDGAIFWCRLQRGRASLMLQQDCAEDGPTAGRGRGVGLYVICDDADRLYAEFTARGLALAPPTTAYYGMRQLTVPEPDGYYLCFESPVAPH